MIAVLFDTFMDPPQLVNVPDPIPTADGVVLEVKATGICRSDWHGWMGHDPDVTLPHVPGHEMCGVIAERGTNARQWSLGQRVTLPFVCGCGHCPYCQQGDPQVCDNQFQPGFTHWGSFAQYVAIDFAQTNLVALPDTIPDHSAAALGCRFATSFRALKHQAGVHSGQWVVVHGCGGVGLSAIMIACALEARVVAVDINPTQLQLAKELGAEVLINATSEDVVPAVLNATDGGAHVSLDALGHPKLVNDALLSLRKRGKHIQVGLMAPQNRNTKIPIDHIISKELELLGSHGMQASKYPEMLQMILEGRLDPGKLVTRTLSLGESINVLTDMDTFKQSGITVITDFSK